MIVSSRDLSAVLNKLHQSKLKSLDTETTGLRWYDNDKLFSIIIADEFESYYFNFNDLPDHLGNKIPEEYVLDRMQLASLQGLFSDPESTWFLHNAKFDMGMLAKDGLSLEGRVHCTEAVARLLDGRWKSYRLVDCVKRMNRTLRVADDGKSDEVAAYVKKHKLFNEIQLEGKKDPLKLMHYELVPFELMADYARQDGKITRQLGMFQLEVLNRYINGKGLVGFQDSYERETKLTKVCFDMEKTGVHLDTNYTRESLDHFRSRMKMAEEEFTALAGKPLVDSNKELKEAFEKIGVKPGMTAKGNPSFTDAVLSKVEHPLASTIQDYRKARKLMSSYYSNFLYLQSDDGKVHCHIKQNGASKTQRMSVINPALQTVPKEYDPEDPWNVRRCFKPPEGWCFFAPDYDQMEYRMMLDMAGEMSVIEKVLGGLDVHTATAEKMGCERQAAKTINFLLLYGGGVQKLADALGIGLDEAQRLYRSYFNNLPKVNLWRRKIIAQGEHQKYVKNWIGGISFVERGYEYKGPNYVIQGGCAQVVKKAMLNIDQYMREHKLRSKMILQLHDELLFAMHPEELSHAPVIVSMMENAYVHKHLPLTAGPSYSWKSWGDKSDGYPTRDAS